MITTRTEQILGIFLKCFIFLSLFIPMSYTKLSSPYYNEFALANLFVGLYIIIALFKHQTNKHHRTFIIYLSIMLVLYTFSSIYVNFIHSRWLWETFNVTFAFSFFIVLLYLGGQSSTSKRTIIRFLIGSQTLTSLLAIITYFVGYTSVSFMNGEIAFFPHDPNLYEKRFSWIYYHKSQYCFILLLFIGLLFAYKKYFKNQLLFIFCNLVCLVCIILSHTYTALFAAFLIFVGYFIDYIKPRLKKINPKRLLYLLPIFILIFWIIYKMSQERDIWSLGSRTYIWSESIRQILQNPLGVGNAFGPISFPVPGISFEVYNCHNVFLNEMYRFSLPVGLLFTIIFLSIMVYSLRNHFSFLNVSIWIALMFSLNMDYALLGRELTITTFYLYIIFFLPYCSKTNKR